MVPDSKCLRGLRFDADSAVPRGCEFLGSLTRPHENVVKARTAKGIYAVPMNVVTAGKDEIYIYGGAGNTPGSPGSFVARLTAKSLKQVWRTQLFDHAANPDQWMYPEVIGIHENGYLYVIYDYWLAKLDRRNGGIIKKTTLPSGSQKPENTSYNGFNLLADGRIVAKCLYRSQDHNLQGFEALLHDPPNAPSVAVVVCPDNLSILGSAMADGVLGGRVAVSRFNKKNFAYLTDKDRVFRYQIHKSGRISLDENWGLRYRLSKERTTALAVAVLKDFVIFTTNSLASKAPMAVWAVSQEHSKKHAHRCPFSSQRAHRSYSIAAIAVDPENNLIYMADTGAGMIAGVELTVGKKGVPRLNTVWERKATDDFLLCIDRPPQRRVLVSTEILGPWPSQRRMLTYTEEHLVWRDAKTVLSLATSPNLGKMPGVPMCPGFDGTVFSPICSVGSRK